MLNLFCDISDVQEFCQNEAFSAKCSNNEVIIMEKALYGRMRLGRCVKTDFGFVGCYTDVLKVSQKVLFSHFEMYTQTTTALCCINQPMVHQADALLSCVVSSFSLRQ